MAKRKNTTEISEDTKLLILVLCLLFAYPAGLILMWVWSEWPTWLKIVLTLPIFLIIIWMFFIFFIIFSVGLTAAHNATIPLPSTVVTPLPTTSF